MLTTRISPVTSRQNSRVKALRSAFERPGRDGLVGIEGEHLLVEAIRSGLPISTIFVVSGFEERLDGVLLDDACEVLSLPADLFASAVTTESPQPLAALVRAPAFELNAILGPATKSSLVIVAAGLQDPGNLGTLIRSAEAFGATGMILLPGTTSELNPKALRASSGSAFRLPIVHCESDEAVSFLRAEAIRVVAAVASPGAVTIGDLRGPTAILIGNEGAGLSPELIAMADAPISIPCPGITESLNAAIAGSVLLYEASRQRGLR